MTHYLFATYSSNALDIPSAQYRREIQLEDKKATIETLDALEQKHRKLKVKKEELKKLQDSDLEKVAGKANEWVYRDTRPPR